MTSSTNDGRNRQGYLRHKHSGFRSLLERTTVPLPSGCGSGARRAGSLGSHRLRATRELADKFADAIVDRLSTHAERVPVQGRSGWVQQDADDDKFIDAALSAGATIIVSGDRHLLALGTVEGIEIVTARQFLDRLAAVSSEVPRDRG